MGTNKFLTFRELLSHLNGSCVLHIYVHSHNKNIVSTVDEITDLYPSHDVIYTKVIYHYFKGVDNHVFVNLC